MKILNLILMVFCLSAITVAENDSVTMGPYNISFDLGILKDDYTIKVAEPKNSENLDGEIYTSFAFDIINKTGIARQATVLLTYFPNDEQITRTPEELRQSLLYLQKKDMHQSIIGSATRTIDGAKGAVASKESVINGVIFYIYVALYYPLFDPQKHSCMIVSSYPWDEGTLSLLKTVHIEKVNTTS